MITQTFDGGVPVNFFLPVEEVEPGALQQIITTSQHPHAVGHVAVMPDTHQGYGVAIGTAFDTHGVIIPNAVGVDIGCGILRAVTDMFMCDELRNQKFWDDVRAAVLERIPVGFSWHEQPQVYDSPEHEAFVHKYRNNQKIMSKVNHQIGTLGGGNHFLEYAVRRDTNAIVCLVHSGSRGAGAIVAELHQQVAENENRKKDANRDPNDLESLVIESDSGSSYLEDLQWGIGYARRNRVVMAKHMFDALWEVFSDHFGGRYGDRFSIGSNAPHNYAFQMPGENLVDIRHRKGACSAATYASNVIPGSMGSESAIVVGKNNPAANGSSSHGAGRVIGRRAAKREFSMDDFAQSLEGTYSVATEATIDESPMAYKDIEVVLERQKDCIEVATMMYPLLTIKGGGRDEG